MGGHVLFETGIRRLGSKENGFFYRYPGTGETVREERVLSRIEELKVPPAWEEARIARSPRAKVQAVGYDSAGRLQYLYSASYREQKEREKFERVLRFADALPEMRRTTSDHLRRKGLGFEKVLAAMTRLMNVAYFRVGDERYAKKNRTYGIATLRRKHLRIEGDTMAFEYSGKWGMIQRKVVTDSRLRGVVEECAALPGYEVFKYVDDGEVRDVKARDLNLYVKRVMGDEFTPKDFRTWAGTLIAALKLAELGPATEPKHVNKNVLQAIDAVAERLGNTRDIARASYISPAGHRPLPGGFRGSLPRRAPRRGHSRRTGRPDPRREGAPGAAEKGAPQRSQESRVIQNPKETQAVKKAIAIKVIKSKTARKVAIKALQNERIRKLAVEAAKRRVLGK